MTAQVIIMPVVPRPSLHDPDWREQYERECRARCEALIAPPPRTRPLIVVDNGRVAPEFEATMAHVFAALAFAATKACEQLIVGQRPEGER